MVNENGMVQKTIPDFFYSNSSYSGTDCQVLVQINSTLIELGNLETISFSIFREKSPVRTLGRANPKGFTSGTRTISGSMVFIVFDRAPLLEVIKQFHYAQNPNDRYTSPVTDQLPPLDMILLFNNEYGHTSFMKLYAVELFTEGQVYSINDLYSENTMQYYARDIDVLVNQEGKKDYKELLFNRQLGGDNLFFKRLSGEFIDNKLGSLLEYQNKLKKDLFNISQVILTLKAQIPKENNKNKIIYGISQIFTSSDKSEDNTLDLTNSIKEQTQKEQVLLKELASVQQQIDNYKKVAGYNGANTEYGSASTYDLRGTAIFSPRDLNFNNSVATESAKNEIVSLPNNNDLTSINFTYNPDMA